MTTTVLTSPLPAANRPAGFGSLLRAEWIKIRSVRSTVWTLVLMLLLAVGVSVLISAVTANGWATADAAAHASVVRDPVGTIFGGMGLAELVACALGVLVVTSEYSSGTIRASLLAVPRRWPVLAAKAGAFGLLTLVAGELASFGSFAAGAYLLRHDVPVSLRDPGVLRAVAGGGLFLAAMSVVAMGLGALIRHTAAAVTGVIAFVLVLSPLADSLPGTVGRHVAAYLPTNAGQVVLFTHHSSGQLLSPWQGLAVCAAWGVGLMLAAGVLLRRRDV
ncbi:ABC transporter permease [Streptacidiphilus sp. PB12-B1b]|uniref:ABC transporter permease n=1 Tax=Streptacidiphilus sp. PB12-B1b TaxID=2705012 RepID=UPI0015F866FF|nr:ABC transporter permease [Streptacidiphilus sp. PB12-B1b]QMU77970.1 ABC transporter permease [Streptacidiphilus sp. PB12-B1b]